MPGHGPLEQRVMRQMDTQREGSTVILQAGGGDEVGQCWADKVRARGEVMELGGCGIRPGIGRARGALPGFRTPPSYASRARDNRRGGANPRKCRTTAAFGLTHNVEAQGRGAASCAESPGAAGSAAGDTENDDET